MPLSGGPRQTLAALPVVVAPPSIISTDAQKHPVPAAQETPQPHRRKAPCLCDLPLCSACRRGAPPRFRRWRPPRQYTSLQERRLGKRLTRRPQDPVCPGAHLQPIRCLEKRGLLTGPPAPRQCWRAALPRRLLAAIRAFAACPTKLQPRVRVQCRLVAPSDDRILPLLVRFARSVRQSLWSQARRG